MSQTPICPKCGAPLADDAPAGLCPKCLVQAGFESENPPRPEPAVTTPNPTTSGFTPPAVEELAKRFPQLEILELLGKGGMGAVYKARQPGLDRLVAVKILPVETSHDPTFAERFTREARALARLSHPNIVAIYDFGQTEGLYFFVMEYVDGVNLRQAIQAGGMTPQNALTIVPQICDALQFAHDEGIVHRDIKPENILIDKRGRVKIADFGLAKLLGLEHADHALTQTRQVMGTLRYMAPEQMEGSHEVDHRADIYSLGVVFYELLTGELPIGRFAPPSKKVQIDVRLDEVVLRALETEPEQRYQHASELKTSVDHITATPNVAAGHVPPIRTTYPEQMAPDARLSRSALFGAIWASYFFIALVLVIPAWLVHGYHEPVQPMRATIPARALQIAGAGDPSMFDGLIAQAVVDSPGGSRELFQLLLMIAAAVAGLIAVAAPFGTTILGFVAIGQIRRSAGKLYGLHLAVFDALLFPLLLLDGLLLALGYGLAYVAWSAFVRMFAVYGQDPLFILVFAGSAGVLAVWLDWRIIRAVWRNVTGFVPPPKPVATAASAVVRPIERPRDGTGKEFQQHNQHADELKTNVAPIVATIDDSGDPAMRGPQPRQPPAAPNPRLSPCALFGAIWASYFFVAVAVLPVLLWYGYLKEPRPLSVMLPAGTLQIAGAGGTSAYHGLIAQVADRPPSSVSEFFKLLMMFAAIVASLIAFAAPFGATILGFVAIGQIRRSDGKLYGLPLAAIDALLFPLLLMDFLIMVVVAAVVMMVLMLCGGPRGLGGELMSALPTALTLLISLPIIAWADYRIARAAWRMISGSPATSKPVVAAAIPGGGVQR